MVHEEVNNAIKALLEDDRIDLAEMLEDYLYYGVIPDLDYMIEQVEYNPTLYKIMDELAAHIEFEES